MTALTDSEPTNRLIKLLMMLPAPDREEHTTFWEAVAKEHQVSLNYVTGKIGVHLELILLKSQERKNHSDHKNLASYALFFFGQASDELTTDITSCITAGAPNNSAGQLWVQQLRECAFAIIEENTTVERVREASAAWIRTYSPSVRRARQGA